MGWSILVRETFDRGSEYNFVKDEIYLENFKYLWTLGGNITWSY